MTGDDTHVESTARASAEATLDLYAHQHASLPPILYHYTSPSGLLAIAESGKIYATNIRYLNDSSEYIYTYELFSSRLLTICESLEGKDKVIAMALREIREVIFESTARSSRDGDIYVVSFSAQGDSLSQWRAYCPRTGGYSIGLLPDRLRESADKLSFGNEMFQIGWRLVRCEYDLERQFYEVDQAITEGIEELRCQDERSDGAISKYVESGDQPPDELWEVAFNFQMAAILLAPVLKHGAFSEEEEWRLVSPLIFDGDDKIHFRVGPSSIVPFVYFQLPMGRNGSPAIRDVIVGPTIHPELSRRAVSQVCDIPVAKSSRVPYRNL